MMNSVTNNHLYVSVACHSKSNTFIMRISCWMMPKSSPCSSLITLMAANSPVEMRFAWNTTCHLVNQPITNQIIFIHLLWNMKRVNKRYIVYHTWRGRTPAPVMQNYRARPPARKWKGLGHKVNKRPSGRHSVWCIRDRLSGTKYTSKFWDK